MFKLISLQPVKGAVNIPVHGVITNAELAQEIEKGVNITPDIETFLEALKQAPDDIFIDPCYDVCPDAFVCAFGVV